MKYVFIATIKAVCVTLALFSNPTTASDGELHGKTCGSIAELAESIMETRQKGISRLKALSVAQGDSLATEMVNQAWNQVPVYGYDKRQVKAVEQFRSHWYKRCM